MCFERKLDSMDSAGLGPVLRSCRERGFDRLIYAPDVVSQLNEFGI
jgi:hypothetical protein